eukprot:15445277-Alexandrium_andersonii.AAC.1
MHEGRVGRLAQSARRLLDAFPPQTSNEVALGRSVVELAAVYGWCFRSRHVSGMAGVDLGPQS